MSELLKWFEKRKEAKTTVTMQKHLATTISAVEDLEKAVEAAVKGNEKEERAAIDRVASSENEADRLRRIVMTELAIGELPPTDREDLMHLMKRVDMIADWSRQSTRILDATPMQEVPETLRKAAVHMAEGLKECATAVRKSINSMTEKPEEALKAADEVERLEEKVDDFFEESRRLLAKEEKLRAGVGILMNELYEAIEQASDACEDTCDQVRVIVVQR